MGYEEENNAKDEHKKHNHNHSHSHSQIGGNRLKLILVILFNSVITVAEYIGGIVSGSLALISDAGHNLSDVFSLILGYAGERVSEMDSGKKYTFGLKRFEVLIALINALSLVMIGGFIVYEAVDRFQNPVEIDVAIMLPVAVIGLLGNVFSIMVLSKNKNSNLNMKAAFLHLLYDAISSIGVIVAGVVIYYTDLLIVDLILSCVIVVMIIWSSKDILRESLRIFLQGMPDHIDRDVIYESIKEIEDVGDVHGLHIWSINSNEVFLSCHILVDTLKNRADTDGIIKNVNLMLEEKFNISHTTLQIENHRTCRQEEGACCR